MPKKDPRIDSHIEKSPDFAKPILRHLRKVIHKNCPEVEETLKWNMPHFLYQGKILCGMAAFKAHCAFGFWNGAKIVNADGSKAKVSMMGIRGIKSVADLPPEKALASYVKQAMALTGKTSPKKAPRQKKPPVRPPADLVRSLRANGKAHAIYADMSPTHRREYAEWVAGAKTEETRERRLEKAVSQISEGKSLHWKYQKR